ncbi:hypothetical protein C0585_06820 [Candidatus Woesearchaeota archaeon]|nr:MAG: hypothetical protein C0585_06820 [Candidatus Woesearchaeota archaeon]
MENKEIFIQAINEKKKVKVKINTDEKGIIIRDCIPFDFGTGKLPGIRYHFLDLTSPDGPHNLSVLPNKLLEIEILDETFNPADYIKWKPNWKLARDWGEFS